MKNNDIVCICLRACLALRSLALVFVFLMLPSCGLFTDAALRQEVITANDKLAQFYGSTSEILERLVSDPNNNMPMATRLEYQKAIAHNDTGFTRISEALVAAVADEGEIDWKELYVKARDTISEWRDAK